MRISAFVAAMAMTFAGCVMDVEDEEGVALSGVAGVEAEEAEEAEEGEGTEGDEESLLLATRYDDKTYFPATAICDIEGLDETSDNRMEHYLDEIRNAHATSNLTLVCSLPIYYLQSDYGHYWDVTEIVQIKVYGDCTDYPSGEIVIGLYTRPYDETTWDNHGDVEIGYDPSSDIDDATFYPVDISSEDYSVTFRVILPDSHPTYGKSKLVGFEVFYTYYL